MLNITQWEEWKSMVPEAKDMLEWTRDQLMNWVKIYEQVINEYNRFISELKGIANETVIVVLWKDEDYAEMEVPEILEDLQLNPEFQKFVEFFNVFYGENGILTIEQPATGGQEHMNNTGEIPENLKEIVDWIRQNVEAEIEFRAMHNESRNETEMPIKNETEGAMNETDIIEIDKNYTLPEGCNFKDPELMDEICCMNDVKSVCLKNEDFNKFAKERLPALCHEMQIPFDNCTAN
jgi:hypothetical protein